MDHNRKLYIETVGCQMNMLDSELVVAALRRHGYELTADVHEADTVLFNTCSVREHAEHKIYSQLGRLKFSKRRRPRQVIGVLGCMAQKDQELIFQRAPHVDLVVGTGQLSEVPRLIDEARRSAPPALAVSLLARKEIAAGSLRELSKLRPAPRAGHAAVAVSGLRADHDRLRQVLHVLRRPHDARTRAEPPALPTSRRKSGVLAEQGVKEVTLLGQTVNSYKYTEDGRLCRLSDLLGGSTTRPASTASSSSRTIRATCRTICALPSAICRKSAATCTCRPSRARTTSCG